MAVRNVWHRLIYTLGYKTLKLKKNVDDGVFSKKIVYIFDNCSLKFLIFIFWHTSQEEKFCRIQLFI